MKAHNREEISMTNEDRIIRLETMVENINSTFLPLCQKSNASETQLEALAKEIRLVTDSMQKGFEKAYEKMDRRFERLDSKIDGIRSESWSQFRWIIGSILVSVGSILANVVIKSINLT